MKNLTCIEDFNIYLPDKLVITDDTMFGEKGGYLTEVVRDALKEKKITRKVFITAFFNVFKRGKLTVDRAEFKNRLNYNLGCIHGQLTMTSKTFILLMSKVINAAPPKDKQEEVLQLLNIGNATDLRKVTLPEKSRLTILKCVSTHWMRGQRFWLCECSCGNTTIASEHKIMSGRAISCGCANKEAVTTHGLTKTIEHRTWRAIRGRCTNSKSKNYRSYGGRGIKVCKRWDNFMNFLSDMGHRPSDDYSIERIDNDGDYEPSNCKWATVDEQLANQRKSLRFPLIIHLVLITGVLRLVTIVNLLDVDIIGVCIQLRK